MLAKKAQSIFNPNYEVTATPQKLLRTPVPYADESLAGYILRMSEANYYQSPRWILQLAGYQNKGFIKFDCHNNKPTKLTQLTGIDDKLLKSKAFETTREGSIISYGVHKKANQLCPYCLQKSSYIRFFWDFKISQVCPIHECNLINRCPRCKQTIRWSRPGVVKCKCDFDFRHSPTTTATDIQLNFAFYLYGYLGQVEYLNAIKAIYSEDNPVFDLSFRMFSRLTYFFESYIKVYWKHQKPTDMIIHTKPELFSFEELVFNLFKDWQQNIRQFLQWYESILEPRYYPLKVVNYLVNFLVELSAFFSTHSPMSIWLERYLVDLLSRYNIKQIKIILQNLDNLFVEIFNLKEVNDWLPELKQKRESFVELNLAKLISLSNKVKYVSISDSHSPELIISCNIYPDY